MKTAPRFFTIIGLSASLLSLGPIASAFAAVKLPAIFSDHMVLQGDASVPVWGWAEPGEEVSVSIAGQTQAAKADAEGKWSVKLGQLKAGETATLTVKGKDTLTINDVLVGDVWLCSGQSNMGMTVNRAQNFEQEKAAAQFPKLRVFTVNTGAATSPQADCKGSWVICTPETVGNFSATAYFFGREVHQKTGLPIGLINSSVGGTAIEAWTSWEAQKDFAELKPIFERWDKLQANWNPEKAMAEFEKQQAAFKETAAKAKADGKPEPRAPRRPVEPRLDGNHPANLYNGKIAPLIPYAIRGAIWYQGESNASITGGEVYGLQLETLIKDWRGRWGYDFPFAWVQLPNFHKPQAQPVENTGWVLVREAMLKTLKLPKTGMAITTDLGEADNIHPVNKQEVGQRLARWALGEVYGKPVETSGPLPAGHEIKGSEVVISFKHTGGGLVAKAGELKGFAVAGADKQWHWATAKISGDTVTVSSPDVKQPVAVRYAWADFPNGNLYNGAGIPATPFRTDNGK